MRRRLARPYGQSVSVARLASMLLAVAVLWMFYERMRDPATWRILADDEPSAEMPANVGVATDEVIVPGPNRTDDDELAAAQKNFEYIIDKAPLKTREMAAYWRLMAWSRSESFADLEKQARSDIPFTLLFEQPERYRGQPVRLRIHVRRAVEHSKPENDLGLKSVYEAWGATDESSTFPYVVVFPEELEGLPLGDDIRGEILFVGYFLKVMSYTDKLGKTRGAPLLIGRARLVKTPSATPPRSDASTVLFGVGLGGVVLIGSLLWMKLNPRKKTSVKDLPQELPLIGSFDSSAPPEAFVAGESPTKSPDAQ